MTLDDLNYYSDPRTKGKAKKPTLQCEDGTEQELPTCWEVCDVCDGEGKYVNPSIDASGITAEQFADDPEFEESYFGGVYDVVCEHCGGKRVVKVADWDRMTNEQSAAYRQQLEDDAYYDAERMAEIRMGC